MFRSNQRKIHLHLWYLILSMVQLYMRQQPYRVPVLPRQAPTRAHDPAISRLSHPCLASQDDPEAFSATAAVLAWARFLTSPCLPFCSMREISASLPFLSLLGTRRVKLTSHLANRRSISPRRSATILLSSFRLRRTTREATAR